MSWQLTPLLGHTTAQIAFHIADMISPNSFCHFGPIPVRQVQGGLDKIAAVHVDWEPSTGVDQDRTKSRSYLSARR